MGRIFCLLILGSFPGFAQGVADAAKAVQGMGLDPGECYRVIDLNFSRRDLRVYFTSGYLIFAKPVNGVRMGAVFSAEVEAGDAEALLLPPVRSERLSLAGFTESPNLDEHFKSAVLLFTDRTGEELLAAIQAASARKVPEMGGVLADKWNGVMRNLAGSFQVRLVEDLLNAPAASGFFYMTVGGTKLGNFDIFVDPRNQEDVLVGQVAERKGQTLFNVWTSFSSRGHESYVRPVAVDDYRIEAVLGTDLALKAVTKLTVTNGDFRGRALTFSISQKMRVTEAKVDGRPVEVLQRESLRSNLISSTGNEEFVVGLGERLGKGAHEFEFHHEGSVIATAGDQVYYVGARGTWYPRAGLEFAHYDLTFRYPKGLSFVATGEVVEDRMEGETRVTRRKTASAIRVAGFNFGDYKSAAVSHEPYKVEVFANRRLERALIPRAPAATANDHAVGLPGRRGVVDLAGPPVVVSAPNPTARLEALANDVAAAYDFMAGQFGPPPLNLLTVSPIPGGFGQGFPGLLYLSTLAYLDPVQRPTFDENRFHQTFFSEMLDAHEVAHQWWGNLVITASYQDAWLMEALANYSALLFLEKKKGTKAMETLLDDYRGHLLAKGEGGKTLESAGPITWGYRLESSLAPAAWHYITYEKGAWVMHMLRRRMGDEAFSAMLKAMCARYRYKAITTEQFRELAAEFGKGKAGDLGEFFENWVYGTGIPAVKLTYVVKGTRVTGTAEWSGVGDEFTAKIPVEVTVGKAKAVYWVGAGTEAVPFSIAVKGVPAKVGLGVRDGLVVGKK